MKFYVITELPGGEVVGCETTKKAALLEGARLCEEFQIDRIDLDVGAESIRRLLGNLGGYANDSRRVYPAPGA